MIGRTLPYDQALRILLEGTCGANPNEIRRETGLSRMTINAFLRGETRELRADTLEALGAFVWRRINASVLLSDEDRRPREEHVA